MENEKHGVPALISLFVPGLGQIIKGDLIKGISIMVAYFLSLGLTLVLVGFITTPILHIWQVYDAYRA